MTEPAELSRRSMVVGFADLAGFFAEASGRDDLEVAEALGRHYERAGAVVAGHGGRVVKVMGDGVLFCFAAGEEAAAVACARALVEAAERGVGAELGGLRCGVGLSCGSVVAGDLGPVGQKAFDVLGDVVNVAAVLCPGPGVKISEALREALGEAVAVERLEPVRRAGRELQVYRVLP